MHRPDRETDAAVGRRNDHQAADAGQEEGVLALLIARHLPPDPTQPQVLAAYERIFSALWSQLAPLMGNGGAQTLFARAIVLAGRRAPLVAEVLSTANALDFTPLHSMISAETELEVEAGDVVLALNTFAKAVEGLIDNLLGPGLSRSLLRDVELALARQR